MIKLFVKGFKMFKIAVTHQEKKQVALYWEEQRKIAADIKDAYDKVNEDAFHAEFYKNKNKNKQILSPESSKQEKISE
tara:strand:- start:1321 stop:1554 length:234 start_codon:yes stop_codon:yes gene_type:complete